MEIWGSRYALSTRLHVLAAYASNESNADRGLGCRASDNWVKGLGFRVLSTGIDYLAIRSLKDFGGAIRQNPS